MKIMDNSDCSAKHLVYQPMRQLPDVLKCSEIPMWWRNRFFIRQMKQCIVALDLRHNFYNLSILHATHSPSTCVWFPDTPPFWTEGLKSFQFDMDFYACLTLPYLFRNLLVSESMLIQKAIFVEWRKKVDFFYYIFKIHFTFDGQLKVNLSNFCLKGT